MPQPKQVFGSIRLNLHLDTWWAVRLVCRRLKLCLLVKMANKSIRLQVSFGGLRKSERENSHRWFCFRMLLTIFAILIISRDLFRAFATRGERGRDQPTADPPDERSRSRT